MSGFATVFQDHVDPNVVVLSIYNNSAQGLVRRMRRETAARLATELQKRADPHAPHRPLEGGIVHFESQ